MRLRNKTDVGVCYAPRAAAALFARGGLEPAGAAGRDRARRRAKDPIRR